MENQRVVAEINRTSLPDRIAESLRQAFATGDLAAGQQLVESGFARQLGVSRGVLREAIRILQMDGWVDFYPNRGCFVLEVSEKDLEEIYNLRSLLEPYAAARVAERATPAQIEHLQELFEHFVDTAKAGNYREAPSADLKLHKAIWEICGSQKLFQFLCSMEVQILRFMVLHVQMYEALVEFASYDHLEVLEAIRNGNAPDASRLMERHIKNSAKMVRDFLKKLKNSKK